MEILEIRIPTQRHAGIILKTRVHGLPQLTVNHFSFYWQISKNWKKYSVEWTNVTI